ncbi:hypothetical protein [Stutzerimonas degradans]
MKKATRPEEQSRPRKANSTTETLTPISVLPAFSGIAKKCQQRYGSPVTVNPVTGFDGPNTTRRTGAPIPIAGAFFVPAVSSYGGCAWGAFGRAGFRVSRSVNPRTAATLYRLTAIRGSSTTHGAPPMQTTRNPSTHAAAWKARAFAALRSDSSLSVRLRRYNEAMARARALEAQGGAQ